MAHNEKQIFDAAAAIDEPDERTRYLDSACGDDAQLRERVESLLNAVVECGSFMQKKAADSFEVTRDTVETERIGQTIGRYKLLEMIGEGGFGDVYMAEQIRPVIRKVALKIIKPGMGSKQVIARFEAERQALALMEHPNIGKFLDADKTAAGIPYFVMELVRGIPVTDYCKQRRLSAQERLELFMEICGAVEHAHQKGIIHRDIKPSNILVYNDGDRAVPKVIDFGIAKATHGRLTDKTLFTQFHQFIGTPAYMSPEQAQMSGVDVDTRSDIYSLGVLLYEMLTGKTPLELKNLKFQAYEDTCRRIREVEALMPSKRVSTLTQDELTSLANSQQATPTEIATRLRGDLDWIVMKSLAKDRSRRYRSTDALSTDIRRHLRDEPVSAGPPSLGYLARKLFRRHRTAALTTLAFTATLVLAFVVSSLGWRNSIVARHAAELSERRADKEKWRAIDMAYLADMQAAHQALDQDRLDLARRILARNSGFDSEHDPRHWEYRALWARCHGNAERSFGMRDGTINGLSVHPDGELIVTGEELRVWNVNTGNLVRDFQIQGIGRFAPSGDLLYTTETSGVVRAWAIPGFKRTNFGISHGSVFSHRRAVQISPNGEFLATFGDDSDVVIWDVETQKELKRISTTSMYVRLAFSPDSVKLVIGGTPRVGIVDLRSMEVDDFLDHSGVPLNGDNVVFSSDGERIAQSHDGRVTVYQVSNGRQIAELQEHDQSVLDVDYSPDGAILATASVDRTVLLHDTKTNEVLAKLRNHDLAVSRVAFLPDGRLVSGGREGRICIWNVEECKQPKAWPISVAGAYKWNMWNYWPALSYSPNGSTIASTNLQVRVGSLPGTKPKPGITLRSATNLQETASLAEPSGQVAAVLFSPVEDLVSITDQGGDLEFITPDDGEVDSAKYSIRDQGGVLVPVRFSSDGKRLLVVLKEHLRRHRKTHDEQKTLRMAVYRLDDPRQLAAWTMPTEFCASISPDGRHVVTGHDDGLRFWSVEDQATSTHVPAGGFHEGKAGRIWSVDFSPDGKHVIAGANINGCIDIVEVQTKRPVGQLHGHIGTVGAVRFSPDGKRVASGGSTPSDTVKIWDFETRREIMTLTVDGSWGGTRHLEWQPDGNAIMVGTGDSILAIFRVPPMKEVLAADSK